MYSMPRIATMIAYSNQYSINNTDLAVLGLVAEGPRHGYLIEQDIAARGMREWTEIGFSSIYYVLNKLEAEGWLEGRVGAAVSTGKRGPARKIYVLTEIGHDVYQSAVRQRLAAPRPRTADFALALANLPALSPTDSRAAIETQCADLAERLRAVDEKNRQDSRIIDNLPPHVEALFLYIKAQMQAELDWLTRFLASEIFENRGDKK